MKSLLQRFRRSYFLVVYVKPGEFKFPIFIPLPIFALEELMESIISLYRFVTWVIPAHKKIGPRMKWNNQHVIEIGDEYLDLALELVHELRKLGPFTLVEVQDKEAHIAIKLY